MVMLFCEVKILVDGAELDNEIELVDVSVLVDETIEDDKEDETVASNEVISEEDEGKNDTSLEDRLGKVMEVHPVKIPVSHVNNRMG